MKIYDLYIYLIFTVKILFILSALYYIYLKFKKQENSQTGQKIKYWKEKFEFIFVVLMSFLLIYLFNPRNTKINMINYETKFLLYLFGFILLIESNWGQFFNQSKIYNNIKNRK
jgi:hypothetical protein